MAGPLAGISAAQIAQQKLPEQAAQAKQGPSSFDKKLDGKAAGGVDHAQKAQQVQHAQQVQKTEMTAKVDQTHKANAAKIDQNVTGKGADPVGQKAEISKSTSMISNMMSNMEKGQASIDKLINGGLSGKSMSNQEMLQLQAGMYKYSQELELTGKVVEKATSGLKDTLKTQV